MALIRSMKVSTSDTYLIKGEGTKERKGKEEEKGGWCSLFLLHSHFYYCKNDPLTREDHQSCLTFPVQLCQN